MTSDTHIGSLIPLSQMKLPCLSALDKFKVDSRATIDQFLAREITLPNCLTAMADALTKVKPELRPPDFFALTDIVIANNARVMAEERRREHARQAARVRSRKRLTVNH